jgi:hypothetical protein
MLHTARIWVLDARPLAIATDTKPTAMTHDRLLFITLSLLRTLVSAGSKIADPNLPLIWRVRHPGYVRGYRSTGD